MTKVFIEDTKQGIKEAVDNLIDKIQSTGVKIIKDSSEVYIKPNAVDFLKHTYTSSEVLEALINKLYEIGAKKIYVMENSTAGNLTRMVFEVNGYNEVCKRTGAEPVYLDEDNCDYQKFRGKKPIEIDPKGYHLTKFCMPNTVIKIIENRKNITYINLPKLKTHSMGVVTLGIKNQWGFPQHRDRAKDHNYNLHSKLVDVFELIQPDLTIIDGIEGIRHGNYPIEAFEDREVIPFNILIGGTDMLSVDVVGARALGITIQEVPHLKIAQKRGFGEGDLNKIEVVGKNLEEYREKVDWNIIQEFPDDVKIVKGKELCCIEGCQNNPLIVLQLLIYDHNGEGGFFMVMGKGFEDNLVLQLKEQGYKRGLVAGYCAIDEIGEKLRKAFGKKNVYYSHDCNNLAETTTALLKLTGVSTFDLIPLPFLKVASLFLKAKLHGSKARTASLF